GVSLGAATTPPAEAHALAQLARIAAADGDWAEATRLVNRALGVVATHRLEDRPTMVLTYAIAAVVHGQTGGTDRAHEERVQGIDLLARVEDLTPHLVVQAMLDLVIASVRRGDVGMAHALVEDAERRLVRLTDTGILSSRLVEARTLVSEMETG